MAQNKKPRKKYNPKKQDPNKPISKRQLNTFLLPLEYFYQQIVDDCVFQVGADVVFLDWGGEYLEVKAAMGGLCDSFERLANDIGCELKLLAIRKMGAWLSVGTPIPDTLIKSFREELDACIEVYSLAPAYQIARSMKTEMIQIELEAKGIIG